MSHSASKPGQVPTLPEQLIRPAMLRTIVEIPLRQIGMPKLLLLLSVLLDERIAAAQVCRAPRVVG